MDQRPNNSFLRALDSLLEGRTGAWFINIVAIPVMFLLILVLPPLALPSRVLSAGYTGIAPSRGGGVIVDDGSQFSIPPNTTKSNVNIKLTTMPRDAFMKSSFAKDLPITLDVKSQAYLPSLQGQMPAQAVLSLLLPEEIEPIAGLDVYGLDGKTWTKLPFQMYLDEDRVEAYLTTFVPSAVIFAQTQPLAPAISADVTAKNPLPTNATPLVAEVSPLGLTIADGGGIAGSVPDLPETGANSPYQVLPTVSNLNGTQMRSDLVEEMIGDAATRKLHVQALVDVAVEKLYPGLNIDYQGINPDRRNDFTKFVRELAQALHAKDKILSVTVVQPTQKAQDAWDTGAYDWDAIGLAADIVRIPTPVSRNAYNGSPSEIEMYLLWAIGRVDRYKIQLTSSIMGRDEFGAAFAPIAFANASKLIGPVGVPADKPQPGDKVTLDLPKLRESGGIKYDEPSGVYTFSYKDDKGQAHTIVLENADSLAKKIAFAQQFNLRGIALRDLNGDSAEPRVWDALKQYRESQSVAFKGAAVITWRVDGQNVGKSPAGDPKFVWTAPDKTGDSKIEAALSLDDGKTAAGTTGSTTLSVARPPTPVPPPVAAAPRPTSAPAAPAAVAAPPSAFRGKNMFGYGIQVNGSDPGGEAGDIKGMGFNWVKIQMPWKDVESGKGNYNWTNYDNFVNTMAGNGIKVLLSIVKAPDWSRRTNATPGEGPPDNMQDAADFMGAAAGRYCGKVDAIEVWNEENLDVEWHDKRGLSAALYMDMLKRAYKDIKAKCPGIAVISGAPTPNGVNNSTAIDDVAFMHQLYQNGLKDYSDGIGVHPSGFRSPPDVTMATPGAVKDYANHRSFFFRETMESYRAVMVQYGDKDKQLWPTEFGWPIGTGGGAHPAGQYNNAGDVANYYAKAYQLAKQWGWVGGMFAWQLDFSGGEVGAFRIKGSATQGTLAGMPK